MSDLPRKNCWSIAEHAGDTTPGRMQHLLNAAKWDTMGAMAAVRTLVCERLDDGDAVAILDESGQEKKGTETVGVKRQYVGCAGRISNAVNIVYCTPPHPGTRWSAPAPTCPPIGSPTSTGADVPGGPMTWCSRPSPSWDGRSLPTCTPRTGCPAG
jgi:hypothetical protein